MSKNVYSLEHICKTIGVPCHITTSVAEGAGYPLLIVSSNIGNIFTSSEIDALKAYVDNGGILVSPFVKDPAVFSLFGISGYQVFTDNNTMTWTDTGSKELRWIDDPLEKTMSLSEPHYPRFSYTCSYTTTSAVTLARYMQTGKTGVARNSYGKGFAYSLGFSFQDLIFLPQTDKDPDSERQYGSGFEPTSDVVMLFIKGIYARFVEYATWKHTLPYNNVPVFVLTHDIDRKSSMNNLNAFANWEMCNNIRSTFFITTHYVSDYQNGNYYDGNIPKMNAIARQGFDIGSHSVGHLGDFEKLSFGQSGNTRQNYTPYDGQYSSTGGTIMGECEVSKNLLKQDLDIQVHSFRPGYLYDPYEIGRALDTLGYTQSSIHSANDVMTNFPYRLAKKRDVTSEISRVLELPISFFTDPVVTEKTDSLINKLGLVTSQVYANYAPFIVLLHSTDLYKLSVQKELLKTLSPRTAFMNINDLATYWENREAFDFNMTVRNDSMVITIPDNRLPVNEQMSLVIDNGRNLKSLLIQSRDGRPLGYLKDNFEQNSLIIYFKEKEGNSTLYPVPGIGGPASVCLGSGFNSYATEPGKTNYTWTISPGGTIISGAGTDTITVRWNETGIQTLSVTYTNAGVCDAAGATVRNILVHPQPLVPAITGIVSVCEGAQGLAYSTEAGMSGYSWNISGEGEIISGNGTNSVMVSWHNPGTGEIGVSYTNQDGCHSNTPASRDIIVNPLPGAAGAITGSTIVCEGSLSEEYSIAPIIHATEYVWTVPAGASVTSGAGSQRITVSYALGSVSGQVTVYGANACGKSNTSNITVTVKPLTKAAGNISGPVSVCMGSAGVNFSIAPVNNAGGYNWSIPEGSSIIAGANTNSVLVDIGDNAASGQITVYASNSCGNGLVSPPFNLAVYPIPPTPLVSIEGIELLSSAPLGNQWYFSDTENGDAIQVAGGTNQVYIPSQTGWYWTQVTLNGCMSGASKKVFRLKPGESNRYNVYPVPNKGEFTISVTTPDEQEFSVMIYNQPGQKIYEENGIHINGEFSKIISLSLPATGIYTVVFRNRDGKVSRKFVVRK